MPDRACIENQYNLDGSGIGGGKGGGSPSTADISGTSNDFATATLGICEGVVEGPVGGEKALTLDDTPIQNQDGTYNFDNFTYQFLPGSNFQSFNPPTGNEVASEESVGVEVKKSIPVTRTIINSEINAIRIRLGVRLQKQEDDGDVKETSVNLNVLIKEGSGAFVNRLSRTIKGRFPDTTVFQFLFPVNQVFDEYTVRIEKTTDDSTDRTQRDLQWLSYAEVIQEKIDYVNTAILWLQFPSKQFKSVPQIAIDIAGLLFEIPSNAVVQADRSLGYLATAWTGAFYTPAMAACDPAWIVWGLLTNKRYGLGIDAQYIDKFALYAISHYNNVIISNGFGGTERRYTFNAILQSQQSAFELIRSICSSMATKIFWDGAKLSFWQDRPATALPRIIANADVEEGRFLYTSQQYNATTTVCKVWWTDPNNKFESTPELVEYPQAIARYGIQIEEFTAFGETRRGGAVRAGRRVILESLLNSEQVSFKCRAIALFFKPGEVIQIADNRRARRRRSGLIKSATTTEIVLDAPVDIIGSAAIFVTMPDMTTEYRNVTNTATAQTLQLQTPLPDAPLPQSNWHILDVGAVLKQYRVINVTPDRDNPNMYEVVAKLYTASRYSEIENGWSLTAFDAVLQPPSIVPPPRSVVAAGRVISAGSAISYTLDVSWNFPIRSDGSQETFVIAYLVEFKRGIDGAWGNRQQVSGLTARWENVGAGVFYVRVAAVTTNIKASEWAEGAAPAVLINSQSIANYTTSRTSVFAVVAHFLDDAMET